MKSYKNAPFKLQTYCGIALLSLIFIATGFYFKNYIIALVGIFLILWTSFRYLRNSHQN